MRMGRPKEMMIGYQVEVTGYPNEVGKLDMFTGSPVLGIFLGRSIGETTRIGMWSKAELLTTNLVKC